MAKFTTSKLKPGETIFGGGAGVMLRGSMKSRAEPSPSETAAPSTPPDNYDELELEAIHRRLAKFYGLSPSSATDGPPKEASPSMRSTTAKSPDKS